MNLRYALVVVSALLCACGGVVDATQPVSDAADTVDADVDSGPDVQSECSGKGLDTERTRAWCEDVCHETFDGCGEYETCFDMCFPWLLTAPDMCPGGPWWYVIPGCPELNVEIPCEDLACHT